MSSALSACCALLGTDAVLIGAAAQSRYGLCTSGIERAIPAALRPHTVDQVVRIINIAREHGMRLYPISTGHNWGYGTANPVRHGCVVLDLSGLDRIVAMDSELGLVTIEPGVTQQHLADYLDRNGLHYLVPVTGGGPNCSLVGNALERGYGITPYADHFGAVMAIEAVLPDGRIYRSALAELGGEEVDRAFKWGVGPYIDGLFAQGNLGIVTRMTIALAPRPERIAAFLFGIEHDSGLEAAVLAIQQSLKALGGLVGSINLMNARRIMSMSVPYPGASAADQGIMSDQSVAELARRNRIMPWTGLGTLYGDAGVLKAARRVIRRVLKPVARQLVFLTPASVARLNGFVRHMPLVRNGQLARRARLLEQSLQIVAGRPSEVALQLAYWRSGVVPSNAGDRDPARDGCGLIWYPPLVPMRPEAVRRYTNMVSDICGAHGIEPLITLTTLSDRCFDSSVPLLFERRNAAQIEIAQSCYRALFDAGRQQGFLPYRMAVHSMDWITESDAPFWDIVAKIKKATDPAGILSPGRYAQFPPPVGS